MTSLLTTGVIRNGRVEVAEPIDLPDGSEVTIIPRVHVKISGLSDNDRPMTPNGIAETRAATLEPQPAFPREVVSRIQATSPNSSQVRAATANLADVLRAAPSDPCFDLESWNSQWSVVDAEMKALTRANDVAESRGS
jgi:hypothetical protein